VALKPFAKPTMNYLRIALAVMSTLNVRFLVSGASNYADKPQGRRRRREGHSKASGPIGASINSLQMFLS
jgi:hypothetical protein